MRMTSRADPSLCTDDVDTVHVPVLSSQGAGSQGDWDPDQATSPPVGRSKDSPSSVKADFRDTFPDTQESNSCTEASGHSPPQAFESSSQHSQANIASRGQQSPPQQHARRASQPTIAVKMEPGAQQAAASGNPNRQAEPAAHVQPHHDSHPDLQAPSGSLTKSDHPIISQDQCHSRQTGQVQRGSGSLSQAAAKQQGPELQADHCHQHQHQASPDAWHSQPAAGPLNAGNTAQHSAAARAVPASPMPQGHVPPQPHPTPQVAPCQPHPSAPKHQSLTPHQHSCSGLQAPFTAPQPQASQAVHHPTASAQQTAAPGQHIGSAATLSPGSSGTPHSGTPHSGSPHSGIPHSGTPHSGPPHHTTPHSLTPRSREERLQAEGQEGVDLIHSGSPVQWIKKKDSKQGRRWQRTSCKWCHDELRPEDRIWRACICGKGKVQASCCNKPADSNWEHAYCAVVNRAGQPPPWMHPSAAGSGCQAADQLPQHMALHADVVGPGSGTSGYSQQYGHAQPHAEPGQQLGFPPHPSPPPAQLGSSLQSNVPPQGVSTQLQPSSQPLSHTAPTPPSWSGPGSQVQSTQPSSSQELQTPANLSHPPPTCSMPSSSPPTSQALSLPRVQHPHPQPSPHPPSLLQQPPAPQLHIHQPQPHTSYQHHDDPQLHSGSSPAQNSSLPDQRQTHQQQPNQPQAQGALPGAPEQGYTPVTQAGASWGSPTPPPAQTPVSSQHSWQPSPSQPRPPSGTQSGHSQQPQQQGHQQQGKQLQAEAQQSGMAMHGGVASGTGAGAQQQGMWQGHDAAPAEGQSQGQKRSHEAAFGTGAGQGQGGVYLYEDKRQAALQRLQQSQARQRQLELQGAQNNALASHTAHASQPPLQGPPSLTDPSHGISENQAGPQNPSQGPWQNPPGPAGPRGSSQGPWQTPPRPASQVPLKWENPYRPKPAQPPHPVPGPSMIHGGSAPGVSGAPAQRPYAAPPPQQHEALPQAGHGTQSFPGHSCPPVNASQGFLGHSSAPSNPQHAGPGGSGAGSSLVDDHGVSIEAKRQAALQRLQQSQRMQARRQLYYPPTS